MKAGTTAAWVVIWLVASVMIAGLVVTLREGRARRQFERERRLRLVRESEPRHVRVIRGGRDGAA